MQSNNPEIQCQDECDETTNGARPESFGSCLSIPEHFKEDLKHRLVTQVIIRDYGCWEWQAAKTPSGYGLIQILDPAQLNKKKPRKSFLAHRISYATYIGDIPAGLFIAHKCDNPPCCNPQHLFLASPQQNSLDRDLKGRSRLPAKSRSPMSPNPMLSDLKPKEVGVYLNVSRGWLKSHRNLFEKYTIPGRGRTGRETRFTRESVERYRQGRIKRAQSPDSENPYHGKTVIEIAEIVNREYSEE